MLTSSSEKATLFCKLDSIRTSTILALLSEAKSRTEHLALADIGSNVFDWPLEGQRGLADGHEICAVCSAFRGTCCISAADDAAFAAYLVRPGVTAYFVPSLLLTFTGM